MRTSRLRNSRPKARTQKWLEYAQKYAHPEGLGRDKLLELAMKATGKDRKRAGYDVAVVLSAKESTPGPRHRSCREGSWIEREGGFVKLRTD